MESSNLEKSISSENVSSCNFIDVSQISNVSSSNTSVANKSDVNLDILHQLLGHASSLVIKKVVSLYKPIINIHKSSVFCETCQYGIGR